MGRAASVGDESGYDTTWGHVRIGVGFAHSPRRRPKEVAGKIQILYSNAQTVITFCLEQTKPSGRITETSRSVNCQSATTG